MAARKALEFTQSLDCTVGKIEAYDRVKQITCM